MDNNDLPHRRQLSSMSGERVESDRERLVLALHARAHADQIRATRQALGAGATRPGLVA
ncbi:MAG TPA: hypothetical protein VM760_01780 [Sphingomicrobium sp.]|nr:hypothetical protein [Sphingomicrobium sp.]